MHRKSIHYANLVVFVFFDIYFTSLPHVDTYPRNSRYTIFDYESKLPHRRFVAGCAFPSY